LIKKIKPEKTSCTRLCGIIARNFQKGACSRTGVYDIIVIVVKVMFSGKTEPSDGRIRRLFCWEKIIKNKVVRQIFSTLKNRAVFHKNRRKRSITTLKNRAVLP
jgi:hypothetical protein